MKQLLVILTVFLFFSACEHKNDDQESPIDPVVLVKTSLMAHTWMYDSIGYKSSDIKTVVFEEPKDKVRFGTDKFYTSAGTGPVADSTRYEVDVTGKIYFWSNGSQKDPNQFYMIDILTEDRLVTFIPTTGVQGYAYYHAE